MALEFAAVANSIAGLSVAGVTLKDIDEIPETAGGLGPLIIPAPDWMTDVDVDIQSFGGGSTALMDFNYTLTYRLLFAPVGAGRGFLGVLPDMIAKIALFYDAVLAVETLVGLEGIMPAGISNFGANPDPADVDYFGCDMSVRILEFVN